MGKLRQVHTGTYKTRNSSQKKVHFGLIVFKNEYEMTQCFENDIF